MHIFLGVFPADVHMNRIPNDVHAVLLGEGAPEIIGAAPVYNTIFEPREPVAYNLFCVGSDQHGNAVVKTICVSVNQVVVLVPREGEPYGN